ncbi:MAG: acyltransferase [Leptolyngbyaceae cyanobacterium bins.349]|nr:acyltransferase [Leptolyngbyaceae cyanobacterium bins.349]
MNARSSQRFFAIDLLKALSITAAVSYHAIFLPESTYNSAQPFLDILFTPFRFCVPVFFTISFFLLANSLEREIHYSAIAQLKKRLQRLLIPTLFWFVIAGGLRILSGTNSTSSLIVSAVKGLIFPGAYFLLASIQLLVITVLLFPWLSKTRTILTLISMQFFVFLLLYISLFGVLGENVVQILDSMNRPFIAYWLVYVLLGIYLFKYWDRIKYLSSQTPLPTKLTLLTIGFVAMMLEFYYLHLSKNFHYSHSEYLMFSCILIVPLLFFCFASIDEQDIPPSCCRAIQLLSKYSLGIFCINGIFSSIFYALSFRFLGSLNFDFTQILLIKLGGWGMLLIISLLLSVCLHRLGLRRCVC